MYDAIGRRKLARVSERPFQKLSERRAALPIDKTLFDGVPPHLVSPLQQWVEGSLTDELARQVCIRLRISVDSVRHYYRPSLELAHGSELLDVVDAILYMHEAWDDREKVEWWYSMLRILDQDLTNGGSLFKVDLVNRCLIERVDESVQAATDQVFRDSSPTAADHLKAAWVAAYGRLPDPDKVFNEAIRAVEEVACPLVERKKAAAGKATLGTVIGELRATGHRWRILLPDKSGSQRSADIVISMMETLWHSQVSRHGGAPKSRRHTIEEAHAALHLAIMLVHWLQSGVLQPAP